MDQANTGKTRRSYFHAAGANPLDGRTIGEVMDDTASSYADNPALIVRQQGLRFTYRELVEQVALAARGLLRLGVEKGDRVGIWATNCAEWVIVQFATARVGAILVTINPAYRTAELEYALRQSECQTLVMIRGFRDCDYASTLFTICPEARTGPPGKLRSEKLPHLKNLIFIGDGAPGSMLRWSEFMESGRAVPKENLTKRQTSLDSDDPINIQYTSGTTGSSKGALLSHHNIVNNAQGIAAAMKITARDRICIPVPFYHCFGMVSGNMLAVVTGATMVVPAEHFNPLATLEAVAEERCTVLHGVPTMFLMELEHPEFDRFDLRSLRTGIMAGAPCAIELIKRVVEKMPCPELTIAYGMTETSPNIAETTVDDPLELRMTTVGKPRPHTEVKIADPHTGQTLPCGRVGELCTRGYLVMKGYYKNPDATRQAIDADGWLHTGDLASMDENGYCRIAGRLKDVIIRGGENIYPREIEDFLSTCPAVSQAQVIGVPDAKYGEGVVAWVKLKEGVSLTAEEIQSFCKGKIADYKIPRHVRFVDSFPMTVTGKIQKFKMREISIQELGGCRKRV